MKVECPIYFENIGDAMKRQSLKFDKKYIRLSDGRIIMCSHIFSHDTFKPLNPVSAGFIGLFTDSEVLNVKSKRYRPLGCYCFGSSMSLNLNSDSQDALISNESFAHNKISDIEKGEVFNLINGIVELADYNKIIDTMIDCVAIFRKDDDNIITFDDVVCVINGEVDDKLMNVIRFGQYYGSESIIFKPMKLIIVTGEYDEYESDIRTIKIGLFKDGDSYTAINLSHTFNFTLKLLGGLNG